MSIRIRRNELPEEVRESIAEGISSAIGKNKGVWALDLTSEPAANAWDVEVYGPYKFHWARRFSGEDRDAEVISAAVRSAVTDHAAA
jgi:hypothetical protein